VKILLQNLKTGLFLLAPEVWTSRPDLARCFPNALEAVDHKIRHLLDSTAVLIVPQIASLVPGKPRVNASLRGRQPRNRNRSPESIPTDGYPTPPAARALSHRPPDPLTVVEANVDVGAGNVLYIRGQGDGLSWDKGQPLRQGFGGAWVWTSNKAKGRVLFRLLLNDRIKARGGNLSIRAGKLITCAPRF
jgi:hypothetical protein